MVDECSVIIVKAYIQIWMENLNGWKNQSWIKILDESWNFDEFFDANCTTWDSIKLV